MIPGSSGSSGRIGGNPITLCRDSDGEGGLTGVEILDAVTPIARETLLGAQAVTSSAI